MSGILSRISAAPIEGSVTTPKGFRAAGVACGIKASGLDLALIVSDTDASAAGVFTINRAQAAPVTVSRRNLSVSSGRARAIVVNSGCANACTGIEGMRHAEAMAVRTASSIGCNVPDVLVASTGVIGVKLDMEKVTRGITAAAAALAPTGGDDAARAIMTTDPFPKSASAEMASRAGSFRVGGIAKGSGMIEPNMATMLAFLTTDAGVEPALLQRALKAVVNDTFNAITVDGECSTNDCVLVLANGASGVQLGDEDYSVLVDALRQVCEPLAIGIVRGGEGATKLVTVRVTGAVSDAEARQAARAIANSLLVKTAIHGGDPNWGRLVAVAGRSGSSFVLDSAAVRIGPIELFSEGTPHDERAPAAAEYLKGSDLVVAVDMGTRGSGTSQMWTCDLSAEYVRINAEYRT
ncbi:MAG TPA: bifunctional glutamate N-acetyltransferase/amino-acid acetyltransferase ArgJ [Vicinamibacterales bacterium]|nr:bifunctional glutamate N-acetyltransferase/amino-acid acetyltransferase ArgJ [Vicinamibacterales bacterium]